MRKLELDFEEAYLLDELIGGVYRTVPNSPRARKQDAAVHKLRAFIDETLAKALEDR